MRVSKLIVPGGIPPWITILIAGAYLVTVTLGIRQAFGLFLVPVSQDLGTGLQIFSLAIAMQNLVWGCPHHFLALWQTVSGRGKWRRLAPLSTPLGCC